MEIICCKGADGAQSLCAPEFWRFNPDNQCENVLRNYCLDNGTDPICSCILSKSNLPHCQDPECIKNGFITKNMAKTPCPTIINCKQDVSNIEIQKGGTAKFNQIQFCGDSGEIQKILNNKEEENIIKALDVVYKKPAEKPSNPIEWWHLLFVLLLIVVIVLGIMAAKKKPNSRPNP